MKPIRFEWNDGKRTAKLSALSITGSRVDILEAIELVLSSRRRHRRLIDSTRRYTVLFGFGLLDKPRTDMTCCKSDQDIRLSAGFLSKSAGWWVGINCASKKG